MPRRAERVPVPGRPARRYRRPRVPRPARPRSQPPYDPAQRQRLHEDAEDHDRVGRAQHDLAAGKHRQRQRERDGEPAAQPAPREDRDRVLIVGAEAAHRADRRPHRQPACDERDGHRRRAQQELRPRRLHRDDLDAEEAEQDQVEQLVGQLPELEHVRLRLLRHRPAAAEVPDDEPGDDHRDERGHLEVLAERVAGGGERQRDEDADRVAALHAAQHREPGGAQQHAEQDAASRLPHQQQRHAVGRGAVLPRHQREHRDHGHDAGAVVEQALAGDLHFHRGRHADAAQDADHGDRVGRRHHGAQQHAVHELQRIPDQCRQPVNAVADDDGRDHHAHGREHQDRALLPRHRLQLERQAAGEQQHAEDAVEHDLGEVDAGKRLARPRRALRVDEAVAGDPHRQHEGQRRDPDRLRPLEEAVVEIPQHRDQRDHEAEEFEQGHGGGACGGIGPISRSILLDSRVCKLRRNKDGERRVRQSTMPRNFAPN